MRVQQTRKALKQLSLTQGATRRSFATIAYDIKSKFQAAYDSKMAAVAKVPAKM